MREPCESVQREDQEHGGNMTGRIPPRPSDPAVLHLNGKTGFHSSSCSPAVLRVFGDSKLALEADLLAVYLGDECIWSVEEHGILREWSLTTGRQRHRRYLGEVEPLWAFGGEGKYLVAAGQELVLFDPSTGRELARLQPERWITALAWSPDGCWLATGHDDGQICLWEVPRFAKRWSVRQGRQPICALAYSRDGECLAAADEDRRLVIWRCFAGEKLASFVVRSGRLAALAWHPHAPFLCSAGWDTHAHVWSLHQSDPVLLFNAHAECVTALAFSPDGSLLATGDNEGVLRLWSFDQRSLLHEIAACSGGIHCLAFDRFGRKILTGGEDRRLVVWDTATAKPILGCGIARELPLRLAVDENHLALVTGRRVQVFDWRHGSKCYVLDHTFGATAAVAVREPPVLFTGDAVGSIHSWRLADGTWQSAWQEHRTAITDLAWDSEQARLASAGGSDGYVYIWAWPRQEPVLLLPEAAGESSSETLAFVPHGQALLVGGVNWLAEKQGAGGLVWWDCSNWQRRLLLRQGVTRLAVRPDGQRAIAANLAGTAWLLELPSGKILTELAGHSEPVLALAFNPRTGQILTGSDDHLLCLWSPDGNWQYSIDLEVAIHDAHFSADGSYLFTANGNHTCYQLDAASLGCGRHS